MKKMAAIVALATVLSGCVAGGGIYSDPLMNLRNASMEGVETYAKSVKYFLATGTTEQAIDAAKQRVADSLKDPGSAQFRDVRLVNYSEGVVVCGEVNGKNAYGGYVGFTKFVASNFSAQLYDKDSKYPAIQEASNAGLNAACSQARVAYSPEPVPVATAGVNETLSINEPGKFQWPAAGNLIDGYDKKNKGLDIGGKAGDQIYAAADGRVVFSGSGLKGYGKLIIIKHDNVYLTAYAHNQTLVVAEGQQVVKGQKIAEMGSSESDRVKLHFEIRKNGQSIDPAPFLPAR